ncbi:hypothetical protein SFRURICE_019618 [Spodoptera frugiperda]|nr:hypothetical protein SFRURICE_019618 [Spodoptera frugiperda]
MDRKYQRTTVGQKDRQFARSEDPLFLRDLSVCLCPKVRAKTAFGLLSTTSWEADTMTLLGCLVCKLDY